MIPFAKFFHHNKRISGIEWVMLYKNSFYQNIPNVKDTCITKKHAIPMELRAVFWSCLLDSNQRPLPYQGSALPLSYTGKGGGRAWIRTMVGKANGFTARPD